MPGVKVSRHFVTVQASDGERQVHYRRAGSGPLIVMLHQSPTSSEEYVPIMEEWGQNFTIIAPDTPGYGLSDPINIVKPTITDFARNIAEFLSALGIDKAALYGMHTGSNIAIEFARLYPERTLAAYAEGVMFLTQEEKDFIIGGYFADFTPQPAGGHLPKIWARMRDQLIFFPWFDRTPEGRMSYNVAPPEVVQAYVVNLLRAGKNEPDAYAAAFDYDTADALVELKAPTFVAFSKPDPLSAQIPRMPELPEKVETDLYENRDVSNQKAIEYLGRFAEVSEIGLGNSQSASKTTWSEIAAVGDDELFVRRAGQANEKRPVLILHAIGSASARALPLINQLGETRQVIAPDLPGHGDTGGTAFSIAATVDQLIALIESLNMNKVDILALETGGQIATALAAKAPDRVGRIVIDEPWLIESSMKEELAQNIAPPLDANYFGGYLLAAWYALRDGELFWPWYAATKENTIQRPPKIDPQDLQDRLCDFLKAKPVYADAISEVIHFDQDAQLRGLDHEVLFVTEALSPHMIQARDAADLTRGGQAKERSPEISDSVKIAAEFFDSE